LFAIFAIILSSHYNKQKCRSSQTCIVQFQSRSVKSKFIYAAALINGPQPLLPAAFCASAIILNFVPAARLLISSRVVPSFIISSGQWEEKQDGYLQFPPLPVRQEK
jgi:hypothetical protein